MFESIHEMSDPFESIHEIPDFTNAGLQNQSIGFSPLFRHYTSVLMFLLHIEKFGNTEMFHLRDIVVQGL